MEMKRLEALQVSLFDRIRLETMQYDIMKNGVDIGFYTQLEVLKQYTRLKSMVKKWEKIDKQLKGAN